MLHGLSVGCGLEILFILALVGFHKSIMDLVGDYFAFLSLITLLDLHLFSFSAFIND